MITNYCCSTKCLRKHVQVLTYLYSSSALVGKSLVRINFAAARSSTEFKLSQRISDTDHCSMGRWLAAKPCLEPLKVLVSNVLAGTLRLILANCRYSSAALERLRKRSACAARSAALIADIETYPKVVVSGRSALKVAGRVSYRRESTMGSVDPAPQIGNVNAIVSIAVRLS
jgi:hypothetical protein